MLLIQGTCQCQKTLNFKINIFNILFGGFMINETIKGVRVSEKAFLTLKEASEYFNIGQDKVRQLTDEDNCDFVLFNLKLYIKHV